MYYPMADTLGYMKQQPEPSLDEIRREQEAREEREYREAREERWEQTKRDLFCPRCEEPMSFDRLNDCRQRGIQPMHEYCLTDEEFDTKGEPMQQ